MECLTVEYRNELKECIHRGRIAVVGEDDRLLWHTDEIDTVTYFRSASKPVQVLPLLTEGLDAAYHLNEKEIAVMSGSQGGEPEHIAVLESILKETGFREDDFIIKPCLPEETKAREEVLRSGGQMRSLYHLCAGKHLAAMILQKYLTNDTAGYWKTEAAAQQYILKYISKFCGIPPQDIKLGIDGCGVPVFAVPFYAIASAYQKLAAPQEAFQGMGKEGVKWREGVVRIQTAMNENPVLVRRTGHICSVLNEDKNLIVKDGSQGVLGIGMKKEKMGIAIKIEDGSEHTMPVVVKELFRQIGYVNPMLEKRLDELFGEKIYNNQGDVIGRICPEFHLQSGIGEDR